MNISRAKTEYKWLYIIMFSWIKCTCTNPPPIHIHIAYLLYRLGYYSCAVLLVAYGLSVEMLLSQEYASVREVNETSEATGISLLHLVSELALSK